MCNLDYIQINTMFINSRIRDLYCEVQFNGSNEKIIVKIIKTSLGSIGIPNSNTTFTYTLASDEQQVFERELGDLEYCVEI